MAIQRWDPLRDLIELQDRMKKLFDDVLSRSTDSPQAPTAGGSEWRPSMDLHEESDRYVLRADLPGIAVDDVEIQIDGDTLSLRGERKPDAEVPREAFLRVERPLGRFQLQLTLPPSVDREAIEAQHRNGVVEVRLPKRREAAPSRIPIASS